MASNQPSAGNINGNQGSSTPTLDDMNKASALHLEANECIENGNNKEGIEKYTQAMELFRTPPIFCNRAVGYCAIKQYDNAINDCHSALKLDSKCARAYAVLGKIFFDQKRYNDAIDAYKKALEVDPEDEQCRRDFAYVEKNLNAKELSTPTPEDVSKANALKEQAIEKYTDAIALNRDPVYLTNRAAAFYHLKKYADASNDCDDAIFLDDKYAKPHGRLAFIYSCVGLYGKAVTLYKKALRMDPNNENYKENLALAETKLREANHHS